MQEPEEEHIGNYRLIRRLGRGNFGEVFLAEHSRTRKQFALKLLRTDLKSFIDEARIMRLKHPHIVRVEDFAIDKKRDMPFIVMDFMAGGTLRQRHPPGSRLPLKIILSYLRQIADALDYIHSHEDGLVHRDVKPENMLIESDGRVLLSDFGVITESATVNSGAEQSVSGTGIYMAPEQIQARPVRASDQYSLGIIVYEWLTGAPPFHGGWHEVALKHLNEPPPSLLEKAPGIPAEVEEVVLKALEKDPKNRFETCKAFVDALERASRPPVGTTVLTFTGHSNRVTALAWSPDGTRIASASNDQTVQVWDAETGKQLYTYSEHVSCIEALAWSPDGTRIASAGDDGTVRIWQVDASATSLPGISQRKNKKSASDSTDNGQVAPTRRRRRRQEHTLLTYREHVDSVQAVAWSPDGQYIASAGDDGIVHLWETGTGTTYRTYHAHTHDVYTLAWSPSGTFLASGGHDTIVRVYEITTGKWYLTYSGHSGSIYALAWSPDERFLASGSFDATVQVREIATQQVFIYREHTNGLFALAWSPDGAYLASGDDDKTIQVWEVAKGICCFTYKQHSASIRTLAWSPDGLRIASGGLDNVIRVWQAIH